MTGISCVIRVGSMTNRGLRSGQAISGNLTIWAADNQGTSNSWKRRCHRGIVVEQRGRTSCEINREEAFPLVGQVELLFVTLLPRCVASRHAKHWLRASNNVGIKPELTRNKVRGRIITAEVFRDPDEVLRDVFAKVHISVA